MIPRGLLCVVGIVSSCRRVVVDRVQLSPVQSAGGGGDVIRGAPVQLRAGPVGDVAGVDRLPVMRPSFAVRASKIAENPPGLPAGGGSGGVVYLEMVQASRSGS